MTGTPKPWYLSRTIVASAVGILAALGALAGVQVDTAAATDLVLAAVPVITGALAIWGRVRADAPVTFRRRPPVPAMPARPGPASAYGVPIDPEPAGADLRVAAAGADPAPAATRPESNPFADLNRIGAD